MKFAAGSDQDLFYRRAPVSGQASAACPTDVGTSAAPTLLVLWFQACAESVQKLLEELARADRMPNNALRMFGGAGIHKNWRVNWKTFLRACTWWQPRRYPHPLSNLNLSRRSEALLSDKRKDIVPPIARHKEAMWQTELKWLS